jgi:single-strand DNA-binding protein
MNKHAIHGRFVRDPELIKDADVAKTRAKFTVAVDRSYGDETDFFDCIVFGKRATVIDKYFSKGSEIVLIGEGRNNSYTDKNGVKRKSYTIVVNDFDFCGSKSDSKRDDRNEHSEHDERDDRIADTFEDAESDIPF